jgi:Protein of unknown function (DUF2961)
MARPYGGLTFLDWGIGRVCAYRWHILDFVSFEKSLRVDLEHGGVSDWPAHYASVAYYYLSKPEAQADLPALADRLPRTPLPPAPRFLACEPAGTPSLSGRPLEKRRFRDLDPEYESEDGLLHGRGAAGEVLDVPLDVPGDEEYTPVVFLSGGPSFAALEASIDGKPLGRIDANRPAFTPWISKDLSRARLPGGRRSLTLRLEKTGGRADGLEVGLVAVRLKPHSRFIDRWSVAGNWPCPKEGGWERVEPPELSQDLSAVYPLPDGNEARWKERQGDHVGLSGGDWLVAYGLTFIESPDDRTVACFIGKDDGLKIWVNGEVAFDQNTWSHATHDQFYCRLPLRRGWNKVLVKCANWNGGWGFALRPADPDRKLRFARSPEA